ncbi:Helix-turn-helix domain-containing protein [Salegentibacter echinorum]|uniref:Helix-turn-helix domain-containing protein n=1 Tax=Salegentibacter echinorum TaxID=1073325 RepID=A0A1M5BUS0_SALEC|nr:helix-turn-helix domain-containing protein [Salegentibacter echinorum]SHF46091.1 Helix-turn-helix domain-containing protein [Salegentibacter echinorum]
MKENTHPFLVSMHSLEAKIEQLTREFKIRQIKDSGLILLDNADFIQMFKISAKTAQNWREEGIIEYAQVKGKIYYSLKDIQAFINRHRKRRK